MLVYDNPDELKLAYTKGEPFIVTYRTIYEIKWSNGVQMYIKQKIYSHHGKTPLIGRGKFIFTTGQHVESLIKSSHDESCIKFKSGE